MVGVGRDKRGREGGRVSDGEEIGEGCTGRIANEKSHTIFTRNKHSVGVDCDERTHVFQQQSVPVERVIVTARLK